MPIPRELDPIIHAAAAGANIDENWLRATLEAESHGNLNAVSKRGAQGIAQLMPDTAAGLGVTDPFDPKQAIPAAARYLAQGLDEAEKKGIQNPAEYASRRYNSGSGYGNNPETNAYVNTVGGYYRNFSSPQSGTAPGGAYGVPGAQMNYAETGVLGPPGSNLVTIKTPSGIPVQVNAAAAEAMQGFLGDLENSGYKITSLGGFYNRQKVGGSTPSEHAWGTAVDINPQSNPFQSSQSDLPANVHDMAAKWGLIWGGDWSSPKDTMHFQWGGSKPWLPTQPTDQLTAAATANNVDPRYLLAVARSQNKFDWQSADAANELAGQVNKQLSDAEAQTAAGKKLNPAEYATRQLGLNPSIVGREYTALPPLSAVKPKEVATADATPAAPAPDQTGAGPPGAPAPDQTAGAGPGAPLAALPPAPDTAPPARIDPKRYGGMAVDPSTGPVFDWNGPAPQVSEEERRAFFADPNAIPPPTAGVGPGTPLAMVPSAGGG